MSSHQRPNELRMAVEAALGVKLTSEERALLAGRLRFDDTPALSQQAVADRLHRSQPHVSNRETQLIEKLNQATKRRSGDRSRADELHQLYEVMVKDVEALGEKLPPKPPKLRFRKGGQPSD